MSKLLTRFLHDEEGQGATEYALILGLIVFGIWVLISNTGLGTSIQAMFHNVQSEVDKCKEGGPGCGTGTNPP